MPMTERFRLSLCGHNFCKECLYFTVHSCLSDISQYPLKCPECRVFIIIKDLKILCNDSEWTEKLARNALT